MRREVLVAFAAFFLFSLSTITGVFALEQNHSKEATLFQEKVDINQDGQQEELLLLGRYLDDEEQETGFFTELSLQLINSNGEKTTPVSIEGGYQPKLHLVDLDGDQQKEAFISVALNERGTEKSYSFYKWKNKSWSEFPKPELPTIESHFKEDYKAELKIDGIKTYSFDLYDRRFHYEKLGLYHNGKLNEPTELIIGSYSTLKITRYKNKVAIRGKQRISGMAPVDTIGYLETIWTWDKDNWKIEKVTMKEISTKNI